MPHPTHQSYPRELVWLSKTFRRDIRRLEALDRREEATTLLDVRLAQSRHTEGQPGCPLPRAKRTSLWTFQIYE
jgi:hypothetical protein